MADTSKSFKELSELSTDDLVSLMKVSMKELLDIKVSAKPAAAKMIRRRISRILTRINS